MIVPRDLALLLPLEVGTCDEHCTDDDEPYPGSCAGCIYMHTPAYEAMIFAYDECANN